MKQFPDYVIADPAGNITLLVTEPVPPEAQAALASELLSAEPTAEQVGYLSDLVPGQSVSIRMSGGEFCGNAALSAAAYALWKSSGIKADVAVDFSGLDKPVKARLERRGDSMFTGTVSMPLPESVRDGSFMLENELCEFPLVSFPGISHVILNRIPGRESAEAAVKAWCRELNVPALGLMMLSEDGKSLTPLVYVREVESLYWESSCASGTCAAAWYFSRTAGDGRWSFSEPGGTLSAEVSGNELRLIGSVRFH